MYKCKICVSFVIYLQILPWNKVVLSLPPHLQMKQTQKSFTFDTGLVISCQQFLFPLSFPVFLPAYL